MHRVMPVGPVALVLIVGFVSNALAQDEPDLAAIYQIKQEAFEKSQLADTLFYLTDVHGPRLTGSPGYKAAAEWAVGKLEDWGLDDPRLETWGEFGRGWSYSRLSIHMLEPVATPLHGAPRAWCSGTDGPVSAETVNAPFETERGSNPEQLASAIEKYAEEHRGKLNGKIVFISSPVEFEPPTEPATNRLDPEELEKLAEAPEPMALPPFEWPMKEMPSDPKVISRLYQEAPVTLIRAYWAHLSEIREKLTEFLLEEGVTAAVSAVPVATAPLSLPRALRPTGQDLRYHRPASCSRPSNTTASFGSSRRDSQFGSRSISPLVFTTTRSMART